MAFRQRQGLQTTSSNITHKRYVEPIDCASQARECVPVTQHFATLCVIIKANDGKMALYHFEQMLDAGQAPDKYTWKAFHKRHMAFQDKAWEIYEARKAAGWKPRHNPRHSEGERCRSGPNGRRGPPKIHGGYRQKHWVSTQDFCVCLQSLWH